MKEQEKISCVEPFSFFVKILKDPSALQYEWLSKAGRISSLWLKPLQAGKYVTGKGSLGDAESLSIGAEVNFVSEGWSKPLQIHLLSTALVEHGSWNGCICSIYMCSRFTKGLLVKICIFFFFSSSPSKAQLFILHSFYKLVMNTDPNPTAFLEIWYSWHQISRIKVKHSLSLSSIAIMKWNMVF